MKISNLEGVRGYMAVWVYLVHATTFAAIPALGESGWGKLAFAPVCVFVLLSGFVTHLLLTKNETYPQFILRRGFRLFPVYLVCLVLSILLLDFNKDVLQSIPWPHTSNTARIKLIDAAHNHFWVHVSSHLTLLHGLVPAKMLNTSYTLMGQAWSLTLEWQFYLVIPFIHFILQMSPGKMSKWIAIGVMLVSVVFARMYMPQKTFLPNMLYVFLLGYFTSLLYKDYKEHKSDRLFYFLIFICAFEFAQNGLLDALPFITWALIIVLQSLDNKIFRVVCSNKISLELGKISYSFYCMHMLVLMLVSYVFVQLIPIGNRMVYGVAVVGGGLMVTILLSMVSYRLIELPAMEYAKRLVKRMTK